MYRGKPRIPLDLTANFQSENWTGQELGERIWCIGWATGWMMWGSFPSRGKKVLQNVYTGSGAHPAPFSGSSCGVNQLVHEVDHTHLYEVLRLRTGGAKPPLSYMPAWRAQGQLCCLYLSSTSLNFYPYTKLSRASATKNDADVVLVTECWRRVVAHQTHPASLSEQTRNSFLRPHPHPHPSPSSPSAVRRSTPALNVRHVACPIYSSNSGNETAELRNKCIAEPRVQLYHKPGGAYSVLHYRS